MDSGKIIAAFIFLIIIGGIGFYLWKQKKTATDQKNLVIAPPPASTAENDPLNKGRLVYLSVDNPTTVKPVKSGRKKGDFLGVMDDTTYATYDLGTQPGNSLAYNTQIKTTNGNTAQYYEVKVF